MGGRRLLAASVIVLALAAPATAANEADFGFSWRPFALAEVTKEGMQSFTDATICDPERLKRELGRVAERGWAAEIGELRAGQVAIAAPITDRAGHTVGAMGIFGPPERLLAARQPRGSLLAPIVPGSRFAVRLTAMRVLNVGKASSSRRSMSRTPPSMTSPSTPRICAATVSTSPQ